MTGGPYPSRSEIQTSQLEQIRSLVAELFPGNKFYSQKLNAVGVTFDVASLGDFSKRFPFTTKAELVEDQRAHPPFGTNLTYPLERYTRFHQTSGTTGSPLRWLDTPESWDWMVETWCEVFRAAGVGKGDRIYFPFTFGPFIGFWIAFEAGLRLGALCIPGGGVSSLGRLKAILENQATAVCCTPTYAIHLAEVASKEKIDLQHKHVKTLIVAGESGGSVPAIRARLEHLWHGVRIFDHHGMTETGPVTHECPARPGVLHVVESAFYAEVLDTVTHQPVSSGETGELILTTLGRTGSPLLRYRTGDLVRAEWQPCACGRNDVSLIGGILGRADDMLVVRGVNVYPGAVEEIIRAQAEVAEYRVHVSTDRALTQLSVEIEPLPDCGDVPSLIARLEKSFQTQFALRVPVTAVSPGSLPRFEMKAKRWVKGSDRRG